MDQTPFKRLPEVLIFTRVKQSTLYGWIKAGRFPRPVKPTSGVALWRNEDLDAWAKAQTVADVQQ
jgi:prophage regulatory protein